jgi:DNA polymerase I-like protein with 3'-5' exonuclease and polymerase domains
VSEHIQSLMRNTISLRVPMQVDLKLGKSWAG